MDVFDGSMKACGTTHEGNWTVSEMYLSYVGCPKPFASAGDAHWAESNCCEFVSQQADGIGVTALFLAGIDDSEEWDADSPQRNVFVTALSTLRNACRNHEQNRDAFTQANMAEVGVFPLHLCESLSAVLCCVR